MAFWPQEDNYFFQDEFARLPGYETQNLRINKGYPEETKRKYDHYDLSRVVWPYKYSYGKYNDLNEVKKLVRDLLIIIQMMKNVRKKPTK